MCIAYLSNEPSGVRRSQRPTLEARLLNKVKSVVKPIKAKRPVDERVNGLMQSIYAKQEYIKNFMFW